MQTISDVCKRFGVEKSFIAERFGIPLRTVQDWYANRRTPPQYVITMIVEILEHEKQ